MSHSNHPDRPATTPERRDPDDDSRDKADSDEAAKDPAAERGERIDTGKQIARGGKSDGAVKGAEPDK